MSVCFVVTLDDIELGAFTSCEGLGAEVVLEQREEGGNNAFVWQLPTRIKYPNIKLTRPLTKDTEKVAQWFARPSADRRGERGEDGLDPRRCAADGTVVAEWSLLDVVPVRWTGPSLNPDPPKVADRDGRDRPPRLHSERRAPDVRTTARSPRRSAGRRRGAGARPKVEHAFLELRDPPVDREPAARAAARPDRRSSSTPRSSRSASRRSGAATTSKGAKKSAVAAVHRAPQPSKLSLEMFLDAATRRTTGGQDASSSCSPAASPPTAHQQEERLARRGWSSTGARSPASPRYVKSVSAKYTLFTPAGLPIRGDLHGEPRGDRRRAARARTRPRARWPRAGAHRRRRATRCPRSRTGSTATRPCWRAVAEANDIDDPLRLRAGHGPLLPAPEEI